jgi:2-C-methyl-D-erythritol 4-phosphate cytidylyltransferase
MNYPEYAIIVAGGKGTRIKSPTPKQFIELHGKPVLLHTLEVFFRYSESIQVILVLPKDDFETWKVICEKYNFRKPIPLQQGGETRFQSVRNGLTRIGDVGYVAIHDGVRPLVSEEIIRTSFELAKKNQSAIASVPLNESIRMTEGDYTKAMDRSKFFLIQTPQTFQVELLRKAYQQQEDSQFTDDASVVEQAGHKVSLFRGSFTNLKITNQEDLIIAEALLHSANKN